MTAARHDLFRGMLILVALGLLSTCLACSPQPTTPLPTPEPVTTLEPTRAPPTAQPSPTPVDSPLLTYTESFRLYDDRRLGEDTIDFQSLLSDGKPLVVNVWAGACPPCQWEMADFQSTYTEYTEKVAFFGIEVGSITNLGTVADAEDLLDQAGVTYLNGHTTDVQFLIHFRITGVPTTYFVLPNGAVAQKRAGMLTTDKLQSLVTDLLTASEQMGAGSE